MTFVSAVQREGRRLSLQVRRDLAFILRHEGAQWKDIADTLGYASPGAAMNAAKQAIRADPSRRMPRIPRPSHPAGRTVTAKGYNLVKVSGSDPLADMARSGNYVHEHRIVMARHLGRPLAKDEFVHHLNGDRLDNRLANLELWTRSHPDGQRVADKLEWAVEFIERYAIESESLSQEAA